MRWSWGGGWGWGGDASGQKIKVSSLLPEVDFSLGGYDDKSRLKKPRK